VAISRHQIVIAIPESGDDPPPTLTAVP
jgi:hypothetical protein